MNSTRKIGSLTFFLGLNLSPVYSSEIWKDDARDVLTLVRILYVLRGLVGLLVLLSIGRCRARIRRVVIVVAIVRALVIASSVRHDSSRQARKVVGRWQRRTTDSVSSARSAAVFMPRDSQHASPQSQVLNESPESIILQTQSRIRSFSSVH